MSQTVKRKGTTCVGIKFKGGVVLATDRRVTAGYIVDDATSIKLNQIGKRVVSTIAGSVSDAQLHSRVLKSEIKLKELRCEREILVKEAAAIATTLQYQNIRKYSTIDPIVGYLVGGVDTKGSHLFEIGADGSMFEVDKYATNGSGSIFIKTILKHDFKKDMSEDEAKSLAEKALLSATAIDVNSGGGVVMMVIDEKGVRSAGKKLFKRELVTEK